MAGRIKKAAETIKEIEGRVSRRAGALGKSAKREGKDVYSVPDPKAPGGRRRARGAAGAAKTGKPDEVKGITTRGRKRIAGGAGAVGAMTLFGGDKEKKEDTAVNKSTTPAKKKYNVGVSKGGVPFKEAFRHHRNKGAKTFTWNGKKYTTELDTEKAKRTAAAKKPAAKKKVGGIRRALFGADGKMGGDKGLLDNKLTRAFTKRDELNELRAEVAKKKPVKKMGGGMMKSKMASKGGARGGKKMPGGMKNGGMAKKGYALGGSATKNKKKSSFPDLTGDGRVTQADILKGRGVTKKRNGGMMKSKMASKGGAKGGRMPGGMKNGGMAKKGYSKGGAVRRGKPRGVGAALRGYGKALK